MIAPELMPGLDDDNRPYFDAAANDVFMIQHCSDCSNWIFYPRVVCPHCHSSRLEWRTASGYATLYSFAIVERPHHASFNERTPIHFAAVELKEGPTMLSELRGMARDEPKIGMALRVAFAGIGGGLKLPVWEAA